MKAVILSVLLLGFSSSAFAILGSSEKNISEATPKELVLIMVKLDPNMINLLIDDTNGPERVQEQLKKRGLEVSIGNLRRAKEEAMRKNLANNDALGALFGAK